MSSPVENDRSYTSNYLEINGCSFSSAKSTDYGLLRILEIENKAYVETTDTFKLYLYAIKDTT